jgi:hypothetical protein
VHTEHIERMNVTHTVSLKIYEIDDVQCKLNTSNKQILNDKYESFSNDLITIINLLYSKEFYIETRNIF